MVAVAVALVPDAISGQTALLISLTSICPGLKPKWLTACALNPFEKRHTSSAAPTDLTQSRILEDVF